MLKTLTALIHGMRHTTADDHGTGRSRAAYPGRGDRYHGYKEPLSAWLGEGEGPDRHSGVSDPLGDAADFVP